MTTADHPRAHCRDYDLDALFVQGAEQNHAKYLCVGCPVRIRCLVEALENRIEHGVWGGMTESERRSLLRHHPTDWDQVITASLPESSAHHNHSADRSLRLRANS
ncbi:WhiB family transcriptional regulator [Nocardiopsis quinghaiensis]|uniref:WhiB family transcriptional regulator n=1 Tax=Nocardiopsis quinghaiensis TaxID=464995 RepID=UPI00123A7B10|nr:WhiB family transcriptional regulator [Nocardiopsis quinghaiensis]